MLKRGGQILLLTACSVLAVPPHCSGADGDAIALAFKAAAKDSPSKAFDIIMPAIKTSPSDRELLLLAVEFLPENSASRARQLAAAAAPMLGKKDGDYVWHLAACKTLRVLKKHSEALANCRKALETDPTVYPVYRELGLTYAAAGNPRKAAETLEQGVEISSSSYQARYYLGRVMEKRGDTARATAAYRKALTLAARAGGQDASYYAGLIKAGLKRAASAKKAPPRKTPRAAAPAGKISIEDCRAKFREEFLKDNLGTALAESDACLKISPSDPELAAERAPLMVRLGKYEEGVKEYERAAELYGNKGRSAALCRVKAAETWQKLGNRENSLAQYKLALAADPQDMNALEGFAAALEARSDFSAAMETYSEILKLEPGNKKARTRIDEIRASAMTNAQILDELKLRRAIEPEKTVLQSEDIRLFKSIKAAEISGAVDYLKKEVPSARGVTVKHKMAGRTRLLLTGAGYNAYVSFCTRDAVKFFEKEGIDFRDIFRLRSETGAPVFDKAGKLTPEGEEVWRSAVPGKKTWLLQYEPVPTSPQAVQADKDIAEAEKQGYREISEPEYLWLLRATDCPEDVLMKTPLSMRTVNDGARVRYLMCYVERSYCDNPINMKLPGYIESYRAGNDYISDAKASTAFFGTGAVKKHRFCEDGKLYGLDLDETALPKVSQ